MGKPSWMMDSSEEDDEQKPAVKKSVSLSIGETDDDETGVYADALKAAKAGDVKAFKEALDTLIDERVEKCMSEE